MLIARVANVRALILVAALVTSCAACAEDARRSGEPPPTGPDTTPAGAPPRTGGGTPSAEGAGGASAPASGDPPPPPAATAPPPARRGARPARDLSGRWAMFVRTNTWTVELQPADGMPDEYAGMAERDAPGPDGRPVNLTFGAVLLKGRLKAWLGPGIIVCEAPFRTRGDMVGTCNVVLAEGEGGPFRARRLP